MSETPREREETAPLFGDELAPQFCAWPRCGCDTHDCDLPAEPVGAAVLEHGQERLGSGYLGSKAASGAFQTIVAAMPPHDTYIETHLGSGVIMRAKPRAARQIGLDRDPAMIDAFATGCFGVWDTIAAADAVTWLQSFDFASAGRALIYADPPYVLSERLSSKRYAFDYTDQDHRDLVAVLRQVPAAVMISGYPSKLYDELLGDWRQQRFQAMTRGGPRTECLWLNFPAGDVQWARFAGRGFTDRQRIKRKAARWAANYAACPPGERLAIMAALLEVEATPAQTPTSMVAGAADKVGGVYGGHRKRGAGGLLAEFMAEEDGQRPSPEPPTGAPAPQDQLGAEGPADPPSGA